MLESILELNELLKRVFVMKRLALSLAASMLCAIAIPTTPAFADESTEALVTARDAAAQGRDDMVAAFGKNELKAGQYLWRDAGDAIGEPRVVINLTDQTAYLYRGDTLVAVSSVSTGRDGHPTPIGIFPVLAKKTMHKSKKYDDAPMPYMQRLDDYGIAMHAGNLPGYPASHGCVRLPAGFAKKLFAVTRTGTEVVIGS